MIGRLLTDYGGPIEEIALCNPTGLRDRDVVRAHSNLIEQLPREVAIALVCRAGDAAGLERWLARLGVGRGRIVPIHEPLGADAMWVQDPFMVKTARGRRSYVGVTAEHSYAFAEWLGGGGSAAERSTLSLAGGNCLVGRDFRIVGAGAIEAEAGKPTAARLRRALARHAAFDPRPLYIYGDAELAQEPFHIDLALALTGCRTSGGKPIVLLAQPERRSCGLDSIAERLGADGFHVLRNPVPTAGSGYPAYNNVLVENAVRPGESRPMVFVPQFSDRKPSLRDHDRAACALWDALGFYVRPVGGWAPFSFAGGALRCATKVLRRRAWRGPERVVPDSLLATLRAYST